MFQLRSTRSFLQKMLVSFETSSPRKTKKHWEKYGNNNGCDNQRQWNNQQTEQNHRSSNYQSNKWYKERRQKAQNIQQHKFTGTGSDQINGLPQRNIGAINVEHDEYLDKEINTIEANLSKLNDSSVDKIEVFKNGNWIEIEGVEDTGCSTTTGSIKEHGKYFSEILDYIGHRRLLVKTADGTKCEVLKQGIMQLRVNNIEIKKIMIKLVDAKSWETLLTGRDAINYYNLKQDRRKRRNTRKSYDDRWTDNNGKKQRRWWRATKVRE